MLLILIIFSALNFSFADKKCYALSIEGGGSHGAFEAGALWQLINSLPPDEVLYNVVTGISTGALNAAGVSFFPIGSEKEMADFVVQTWLNINNSSTIFEEWNDGIIGGLFFHSGLYNNAPLKKFVKERSQRGIHRNITVGSTNLDTGLYGQFNESLGNENMTTAILCSADPPAYFPPTWFQGHNWADGGCIINLDVFAAVNRCLDIVSNQSDIIVDLLFDTPDEGLTEVYNFTTLSVISRIREIKASDTNLWFLYNAVNAWPDVNFRYIILPSQKMPGGYVPLDFDRKVIEWEIELGKNDTKKALGSLKSGKESLKDRFKKKDNIIYP
ncbi:unnamed protein product [Blepharisma stoltei]|uniref:PNPLA domain-containing protein n=1 Tax=Blepharisma stoltei TaxID=1481888 RepID=A0AAU9JVK1_9CILI|nr:unnamed protein product [Blepharisma stoltei]